jgi:hypothetical protein
MKKWISILSLAGAFFLALGVNMVEAQPPQKKKGGFDREKFQKEAQERAKKQFEEIDANKDGKINRSEYVAYLDKAKEKLTERIGAEKVAEFQKKQLEAFDKADPKNEGLTFEQFNEMRRAAFGGFGKGGAGGKKRPGTQQQN